ncbi:CoA transferase [Streptomyces verrucosisporus]|uniref:CoA transferase n=1 Tax=Streptomyces verrucosisporus TaxID=1695161 RepID=UPI0019D0657D|nr:CoA transferase [Streptomyces verrucosisporus]MBN3929826.1 CoA transferase [Streptomyces verrucosisporus]
MDQRSWVRLWAALGGDPGLCERVRLVPRTSPDGSGGVLPARLPVRELARSTVAVCALAAAEFEARRTGRAVPGVGVDDGAVATAFVSERHLRIDGRAPSTFAPLSRFWRTDGGWLRTHANYPHHRARLLSALGVPDTGGDEALVAAVAGVLAERRAEEVEEAVYAAGGLAVAVRTPGRWSAHPQGAAVARLPLLGLERLDDAPALPPPSAGSGPGSGSCAGLRVLDLTRVIAGPVATRTLALLGADVLRIDSPRLPESADAHADTGFGKRSALLDLASRSGRASFEELLGKAHVVVTGYRPGALDRFGLSAGELAGRRPGVAVAELSAWGGPGVGPWGGRRGFDSLVQAASGIAVTEGGPDGDPGVLPAQALDHGTGYLLAAAVLRSLTDQRDGGGSRHVRLALARTAHWLQHELEGAKGPGEPEEVREPYDPADWLDETGGPLGRLRHAVSPVAYDGGPEGWSRPPGRPGGDEPVWG